MIVVLPAIYVIAAELTSCLIRRSRRPGPKVRRLFPGGRWIRTGSPTLVFLLWIRLEGPTRLLRGAQQRISSAPTPEQLIADSRLGASDSNMGPILVARDRGGRFENTDGIALVDIGAFADDLPHDVW